MFSTLWSELTGNPESNQASLTVYRFFGGLLLLGFIMPIIVPGQGIWFPNILALTEQGVPPNIIFLSLYPLLAGIAVLVLTNVLTGIVRGLVMAGIGLLPLLLFFFDSSSEIQSLFMHRSETAFASIFGMLGLLGLVAAGMALCHQQQNMLAVWIGGVCGGLYLISLLIPRSSNLESIGLYAPFLAMQAKGFVPVFTGLLLLAAMVSLVLACVFSLLLTFSRPLNTDFGRKSYRLILLAIVFLISAILFAMVGTTSGAPLGMGGPSFVTVMLFFIKILCWIGPAFVLVPLGFADFLQEWAFQTGQENPQGAVASPGLASPAMGAPFAQGAQGPAGIDYDRAVRDLEGQRNRGEITNAEYWRRREELLQRKS